MLHVSDLFLRSCSQYHPFLSCKLHYMTTRIQSNVPSPGVCVMRCFDFLPCPAVLRQNGRSRGPLMDISLSQLDQPATPLLHGHPGQDEPPPPRPPPPRDSGKPPPPRSPPPQDSGKPPPPRPPPPRDSGEPPPPLDLGG